MNWLEIIRTFWPVIASLTPIIFIGFIVWLRSQFVLKSELETERQRINAAAAKADLEGHDRRIGAAEIGLLEHGARLRAVEQECERAPTRNGLQVELSNLGQRMRGLEVGVEAMTRQASTTNDYLHTLIQKDLK